MSYSAHAGLGRYCRKAAKRGLKKCGEWSVKRTSSPSSSSQKETVAEEEKDVVLFAPEGNAGGTECSGAWGALERLAGS